MSIQPVVGIPGARSGQLHFVLACRSLPMRGHKTAGIATVQDPYIKWYSKDRTMAGTEFEFRERTKHRVNEPDPEYYDTPLSYDWMQGQQQMWRFEVYDFDPLNKDDAIGHVEISVDDYVARGEQLSINLDGVAQGTLLIQKIEPIKLKLAVMNVEKKDLGCGHSDPYIECFWTKGKSGPLQLFHKTKVAKNVENYKWEEEVVFPVYQPGTDQMWTFKVWDKDPLPKDDTLGETEVDVDKFVKSRNTFIVKLVDDESTQLVISPA